MELSPLISYGLLLILLYASAWISSSETALFSLSSHKVKTYEKNKDPIKRLIADLLSHPRDILVTVFMINTFVNILLQNVASDMFGVDAGWELKVGVPLFFTLIFGEIIPKYIGLENNTSIAYKVTPTLNWLNSSLKWLRRGIISITTPISRVMFFFLKKEPDISKKELEHVIQTSAKQGILDHGEAELLEGFLNLQERPIKELMWPKEDIFYYDIEEPLEKLLALFIDKQCTRVPVCKDSLEQVIGIITVMDFFQHQNNVVTPNDLISILQKPFFVPETVTSKLLLKKMDEANHILALVVDEYGTIEGLISRQDIIELVVGRIEDEKEINPLFIPSGKNGVIASGKWELMEFNEYFKTALKSPGHQVTVGGWLTERLEDIPKTGSRVEFENFTFHILAASPTRITRLFIRKRNN